MDHIQHIRHAENKQLQLQVARELGLDIPRTLTTNDPTAVRAFAQSCEGGMVTKMLSSFAIYDEGKELVVFHQPRKARRSRGPLGTEHLPCYFQELIPKSLEIRVTVVGQRVALPAFPFPAPSQISFSDIPNGDEIFLSRTTLKSKNTLEGGQVTPGGTTVILIRHAERLATPGTTIPI